MVFGALKDWLEQRRAIKELRAAEGEGSTGFSAYFKEQIALVKEAINRQAHEQALLIWHDLLRRFPDLILKSEQALNQLVDLGCYDEAEELIEEGRRSYPRFRPVYAGVSARVAYKRGDLDEALRRCAFARRKFPRVAEGYTVAATCLSDLGRPAESDAMTDRAAHRFPKDLLMNIANARNADRAENWPVAMRRWEVLSKRFGDNFLGPLGVARSLRGMGRLAEAKQQAMATSEKFPKVQWIYAELAEIAQAEGDLEGISRCWELARERCPDYARGYVDGAAVARKLGKDAEADEFLRLAVARIRYDLPLHQEYARSAERGGNEAEAARRWSFVHQRFPACEEAQAKASAAAVAAEEPDDGDHAGNDQASTS
jgi:tetratricopeptide (TPR) repeat protein